MRIVWLAAVFLLLPRLAGGQTTAPPGSVVLPAPIVPRSPAEGAQIIVDPRLPPPPTIPSVPEVIVPIPPPPETTRPVKIFDFRPTLTVSEEYTDNFNLSATDKVSNFRTSVAPGLLVLLDHATLTGSVSYTPTAFYDSSVEEANLNHALTALLAWQATPRFKLSLGEVFTRSDEPERANRLNLRRARRQFTSNQTSVTGDYVFEPFTAQAYYRLSTFSSDTDDTITHTPGASASMALAQINILTLGYEYLHTKTTVDRDPTPEAVVTLGAATEDSTTTGHQVTATYSRELRRDLTGGLTAVYAVRERERRGEREDFTRKSVSIFSNYVVPEILTIRSNIGVAQLEGEGSSGDPLVITNSDITYFRGPATLGLRIEQGFSETFGQGQNFGVVETFAVSGSIGYRFTPLLSALGTATYRETKFTGEGGGQAGRDDETISATARLTYQFLRWLSATLDYTYTDTKSSDPLGGYVENRVRAALNASFY
jgi:predicted porin